MKGVTLKQIQNWKTSKKETSVKRIQGLEGIRFVAAAGYHSLAISDIKTTEGPPLSLYSWGCGAYWQLGHNKVRDCYNLSKPKRVKFR